MKTLALFLRLANRPCRDMTALISASLDERLGWPQRWAFRLHIVYCQSCRRYRRHVLALRHGLRRLGAALRGAELGPGPMLTDRARERIAQALRKP